jgi:hypothetical protein
VARRVAVAVLVVVLGCVAATVHAEPAAAYYDAITTAADWEVVNGWLNNPETYPGTTPSTSGNAAGAFFKARRAIGRVPSWAAAGSGIAGFTLAAGGSLYLGWEIGHASGASDWAYGKVLGWGETAQPQPAAGSIRAYYWKVTLANGSVYNPTTLSGSPSWTSDAVWVPEVRYSTDGGSSWSPRTGYVSGCVFPGDGVINAPCNDGTYTNGTGVITDDGECFLNNTNAAILGSLEAAGWGGTGMVHHRQTYPGSDYLCDIVYGESTTDAMARFRPTEQRAYSSTTDAFRKTNTASTGVPKPDPHPSYPSGTGVAEAEAAIENDPDLGPEIGRLLHPDEDTGDGSETVTLPQPRFNETYAQYRSRLRALGFLGTITLAENAGVDVLPEFGPNVVTEVQVTTTTGTELYPLLDPWPEPPPTLAVPGTTTEVTIEYNPDTAPAPGPDDPGGANDPPPGNAPPPGGGGTINVGDCSCPAPDFSPITGIDYGDKFPFAVVTIADGLFGTTLYAPADAPSWSFDFTSFEAGGFGPYDLGTYEVDLEVLDEYAALMRTLISWVIWIGGLWWFGSRLLGFHGTGDPGEVVDEAWSA